MRLDGRIISVEVRHTFIQWNAKPAILTVLRDLTERKRAEYALQETERRYLTIAANLPGAVYQRVMYPDGSIVYPYISRGVLETHGVEAENVKRDGSLLTGRVHPEDRERFSQALKISAEDHTPFDMEVRTSNLMASWCGCGAWQGLVNVKTERPSGMASLSTYTARKQAEERAAQAYRWLTEAIDSLSDGFALWDSVRPASYSGTTKFYRLASAAVTRYCETGHGILRRWIECTANDLRRHAMDDEAVVAGWVVERRAATPGSNGGTGR